MSDLAIDVAEPALPEDQPARDLPARDRRGSWAPTWGLVASRMLELRKRRGLMVAVAILTFGIPVIFLGIRLLLHTIAPSSYGPAGSPVVFQGLSDVMRQFGFIAAATLGATAGTSDLSDGVFRHLVVTGRSRLALYLARIPAGLAVVLPCIAVGFTVVCLSTSFLGTANSNTMSFNGVTVPKHLDASQLKTWIDELSPSKMEQLIGGPPAASTDGSGPAGKQQATQLPTLTPAMIKLAADQQMGALYDGYLQAEKATVNPPMNEMVKIGLWIELEVVVAFTVGLGFGSLVGQRTVATIMMIVLEIIVTPLAIGVRIPHLINAQRLVVGVAMQQLSPAAMAGFGRGGGGPGGEGGLPPMPHWALIAVIVGWIVVWSGLGAWRMVRRDA